MLENADIERLKEIFVTRERCDTKSNEVDKRLETDTVKLALIEQQLKTIGWVSKTTLGAVIVAIIGAILSLILK